MVRSVDLLISDDLLACLRVWPWHLQNEASQDFFTLSVHTQLNVSSHSRTRKNQNIVLVGFSVCRCLQSRLSRIQLNQYLATQLQKQTRLFDGMGYVYLCVTICCFFSTDWHIGSLSSMKFLLKSFVLYLCAKPSLQSVTVTQAGQVIPRHDLWCQRCE